MPVPIARGIIIAASVLVAAGLAVYHENPQFREWFDRSRDKMATAWRSALDDISSPQVRRRREDQRRDSSMQEEQSEKAEEMRRQAREEIMERGRRLEAKRRQSSRNSNVTVDEKGSQSPSFDTLVDEQGKLLSGTSNATAKSSAVQGQAETGTLRSRHLDSQSDAPSPDLHQSVDAPMMLRQLQQSNAASIEAQTNDEPWESRYEQEMRNTWNIPLTSPRRPSISIPEAMSTHGSESLINLTPTTEDFPDPDYSVPSPSDLSKSQDLQRTEYFFIPPSGARSSPGSTSNDASAYYYAHPTRPDQPIEARISRPENGVEEGGVRNSSTASLAGSLTHIHPNELESISEDDFSELGDGIRTPASAWTEVESVVSGEDA